MFSKNLDYQNLETPLSGLLNSRPSERDAYSVNNSPKTIPNRDRQPKGTKEFFYSKSLDAYVSIGALKVDDRVVKAAYECGVNLDWDDEGRIINVTYADIKKLSKQLGTSFLSSKEFWRVYNDALSEGRYDIISQLKSNQHTEWLDTVFIKDECDNVWKIDHPQVIDTPNGPVYEGEREKVTMPDGRPGWFNPVDNIDTATGLPINIDVTREKGTAQWSDETWKFWSVYKYNEFVAAMRGYVTSSGTPSFDLDMPTIVKEKVLTFRECVKELPAPPISQELLIKANEIINIYTHTLATQPALQNPMELNEFYSKRDELLMFIKENGYEFINSVDKDAVKIKEKIIDILGLIHIIAKSKNDTNVLEHINEIACNLFDINKDAVSFEEFKKFIQNSKSMLCRALESKNSIVFVMGHKNPDSDTVISSITEAFRNSLLNKDIAYIPVVQANGIPDEIRRLVGDDIADSILLSNDIEYLTALKSGQARWILVDQNVSEVQRFAISIVDHHILSDNAKKRDIPITWEMAGSTASLISQKFNGMGLELDEQLSRILYGATLMDTENRSERKMTLKDSLIMGDLKSLSNIENDAVIYQDLMGYLLNTDDADLLFNRDYKQDWGIFGYAVAKVKGAFDESGNVTKPELLKRLEDLANKNNKDKNYPLTIVKVADYLDDNETVNRERVYLIFNHHVLSEFKDTMFEFVNRIIKSEFKDRVQIEITENSVDFWGVGDQLSRKVTAPYFEPIVRAFNEYYYSPSVGLYVKREFMKLDDEISEAADKLGIKLSLDKNGRLNNITYNEAKLLTKELGLTMMSLPQYWQILNEAELNHDEQMLSHLRSKDFVEFLDTVIMNNNCIINHPDVTINDGSFDYLGEKQEVDIPVGVPGLIYPEEIDSQTGFPTIVHDPRKFGDPRFWRYWSPDADLCIPTRGIIFLYAQPAFDAKVHPDDALPNLGIRPCCYRVNPPKVEFIEDENGVHAKIIR